MCLISGCLHSTPVSWLPALNNVAPPLLRRKAASDKMLQIIEAHPNWPVYADVFKHRPSLSAEPLLDKSRPMPCNSSQMGPCQITEMQLWPAAEWLAQKACVLHSSPIGQADLKSHKWWDMNPVNFQWSYPSPAQCPSWDQWLQIRQVCHVFLYYVLCDFMLYRACCNLQYACCFIDILGHKPLVKLNWIDNVVCSRALSRHTLEDDSWMQPETGNH